MPNRIASAASFNGCFMIAPPRAGLPPGCRGQLMLTMLQAASDAMARGCVGKTACKRHAKCLNPKESAKLSSFAQPDGLHYSNHRPLFPPKSRLARHAELIAP